MSRILLVDDERSIRASVSLALECDGHEVETVARGEEALALLERRAFDLVIAERALPVPGSADLMEALLHERPDLGLIVTSASGSVEEAVEVMRSGACHYLRKPIQASELREAVRRALFAPEAATDETRNTGRENADFPEIIGASQSIRELLDLIAKVAATDSTVLISGETGTGKELVGRAIHHHSRRRHRVFSAVNSAAFPETLLESELFGHRRGAFTGASVNKKGLFEHAHQGTVFLDEVAEMPLSMQAKLLRFLQTGEIRPVGGESTRCVDVRLVTATNKDLEAEVVAGRFREDLYYRLAVIPVHVPALRERLDDLPLLVRHFLERYEAKLGVRVGAIDDDALARLRSHAWPGNVRELENTIERAVALCRDGRIGAADLPARFGEAAATTAPAEAIPSLQVIERTHILTTLEKVGWNRKRAAEVLEISTTTLWRRLKEFGVDAEFARSRSAGGC